MARVPTVSAPTVRQDASPLSIRPATPFASVLGAALAKTGQIEEAHSDALASRALQMADADNKARVDEATINLSQAQDQFELDYKANHRGLGAVDNLTSAFDALEEQRRTFAASMTNPDARERFNTASRVATQVRLQSLSSFAASQRESYITDTHNAVVKNLQGLQAQDPGMFAEVQDQINQEVASYAQHAGWGPDKFAAEVSAARTQSVDNVVTALGANDPLAANSFLEEHRTEIDGEAYAKMHARLQPSLDANSIAIAAKAAVSAGIAVAAPNSSAGTSAGMATVRTQGLTVPVAAQYADRFQGFLNDLEAAGYKVHTVYGAGKPRNVAGTDRPSYHNDGLAIDINPEENTVNGRTNLPRNVGEIAAKWGLGWGGNWHSKKDYMHFSIAASEGGSVDVARGASTNSSTGGAPTSLQLQASRNAVIANSRTLAERDHPGSAAWAERYEAAALSELNQTTGATKGLEAETYAVFSTAIEAGHVDTEAGMLAGVPDGLNLFNSLPPSYQQALRNQTTHNANEMTPERQSAFQALIGLRANNNAGFQGLRVEEMDLPWTVKKQVLQWQAADRKSTAETAARTNRMSSLLGMELVKQGMVGAGIQRDTPAYNQFTGALLFEVEQWQAAHPKDRIDEKTVAGLAAPLLAARTEMRQTYIGPLNIGEPYARPIPGSVTAEVPEAEAALITKAYTDRGLPPPPPWEIGYRYEQMRSRNARR